MYKELFNYVKKYGIFAVLFVGLLVFVLSGYEKREGKLMNFLETQSITNTKIAGTLERLDLRMCSIENKMQKMKEKE